MGEITPSALRSKRVALVGVFVDLMGNLNPTSDFSLNLQNAFDASSGVMVSRLFSGLRFSAGKHAVTIDETLLSNDAFLERELELRVVSAPDAKVKYV